MRYGFLRYSAHEVLRFWIDRGVDGFRVDVVHCIGKDPHFADDSRCLAGEAMVHINDQPYSTRYCEACVGWSTAIARGVC